MTSSTALRGPFSRGIGLWLVVQVLLLVHPAALHAQQTVGGGRVLLPNSIRQVAPVGGATAAVPAAVSRPTLLPNEAATPIHIEAILKMRHFAELQSRVAAGETISRAEMAARFLPGESDYQAVAQWMTAQGLTVAAPGASHTVVSASGTPDRLQQAFQTSFARVTFRGAEYTAAVTTPSLPAEIEARVANIHGLQPYLRPHKSAAIPKKQATTLSSSVYPPYLVSEIANAYDVPASGLTGAGQQIGIVIDAVPLNSDLTKFWSANGVNQSLSNIITVNVESSSLPAPSGEETLDVSWSSGLAPGAQIVIYACGDLGYVNDAYSRILDDLQDGTRPNLHQISMSYGAGEQTDETPADMQSVNQLFTAISAYGVTLFASSGDNGAYTDGDRTLQVSYPASDPTVTGVGGTSLYLDPSTGAVTSETAWSATSSRGDDSSGGGVSGYWSRPSWQVGSTVPSGTMRLVPDVALTADPNQGCYLVLDGEVDQYGGTSWSSPCWAGLCALLNQARTAAGQSALGVANPYLYPLLGTTNFRDITSGYNGHYYASTGFDLVTGLGVPDLHVLEQALLGGTVTFPVITSPLSTNGTVGSTFSYQITASNTPTSFSASGLPGGLTIDTTMGLITGTPTASGTFSVLLGAMNSSGTGSATLVLTVTAGQVTPVITSTLSVNGIVGNAFSYQIAASNMPTSFSASGLPGGLSISTTSGLISGAPTTTGTYTVLLGASNAQGTGTAALTLSVASAAVVAPVITSNRIANGEVGLAFAYQIAASNSPTSYNASNLPAGLSIDTGAGLISGTPTTAGTYTVTLTAANSGGTGSAILSLTVAQAVPVITSALTATGQAGQAFSYQITASNSPTAITVGTLPTGLSYSPTLALILGTPTTPGTYAITVSATNGSGTGTATLVVTVTEPLPTISNVSFATGQVGQPFAFHILANNAATSYTASGLPAGLSVDTSTGTITGTPTAAGTYTVTLTATNSEGSGSQTFTLTVVPAPPAAPVATLAVTTPSVTVGSGGTGVFTVTLSTALENDLFINYSVKGTGINGTDYTLLKGSKKIKAGLTSKPIKIIPLGDLDGAAKKTVKLTLLPGTGYTVGTPDGLKVKIFAAP